MKRDFIKRNFLPGSIPAFLKQFFVSTILSLGVFMVAAVLFSSCNEKKQSTESIVKKDVYFTCSMHPQIHEDHPGNCPICGMKLIPVAKKGMSSKMGADKTTQVHLSDEQIMYSGRYCGKRKHW
jgi:Cu(I)/Ag(I) efflux system membrane fusion protein